MSVVAHPSTIEISQVQPQHHYVVSLKSWTKTNNRLGRCDRLHLTIPFCSKILGAPIISQVLFSHNGPYYTFTSRPPKTVKMMVTTTTTLEILDPFIISFDLVPKMQTLALLFPSSCFWHNEKSSAKFKKRRSSKGLPSSTEYYQNPNKLHIS
jgi:hypothetical protein